MCFLEIGYTVQALDHLQQSLAISQEIGDSMGQVRESNRYDRYVFAV